MVECYICQCSIYPSEPIRRITTLDLNTGINTEKYYHVNCMKNKIKKQLDELEDEE